MKKIFYIMGVSGTGKSTIGKALGDALDLPFFDGDDFHPRSNIKKMGSGNPLNDDDRIPWLERLRLLAGTELVKEGAVIACSALKESYREILTHNILEQTVWIFLEGTIDLISDRMKKRSGHFMPPALLQSQFDTLELPQKAIVISISDTPEDIVKTILAKYNFIKWTNLQNLD